MNLVKSPMNEKPKVHTAISFNVVLFLLFGMAIGFVVGRQNEHPATNKTILVPSENYAKPYDVCQNGFPFVPVRVQVQGKEDKDETTWVIGHPLGQKQIIVCVKDGNYIQDWKIGGIISLSSATPT